MSLSFRRVELADRERVCALLHNAPDRGCEYTFGNLFIWRDVYDTKLAFTEDGLCVVRFDKVTDAYLFPFGQGDVPAAILAMRADAGARGIPFRIIAASADDVALLDDAFPGGYTSHTSRDFAEYVYNAEDLIELKGKKYHGKRNHISRFSAEYPDYQFQEITPDNIGRVQEMNNLWYNEIMAQYGDESLAEERCASRNAFEHFFELGFKGGFIEISAGIVGFAMGEPINPETFCVHIEKACYNTNGAYTVINRDFARHYCADYRYINREDDVGDEGLRKAKLSYYPAILTDKYVIHNQ